MKLSRCLKPRVKPAKDNSGTTLMRTHIMRMLCTKQELKWKLTTRCRWPPERFKPRLPIIVLSPFGSAKQSSSRPQARIIWSYQCGSSNQKPQITSLIVPFGSQGVCSHQAIRVEDTAIVPLAVGSSPISALESIVLPLPTGPEHIAIDPLLMTRLIFASRGGIDGLV